jgi:hypothetical protein
MYPLSLYGWIRSCTGWAKLVRDALRDSNNELILDSNDERIYTED